MKLYDKRWIYIIIEEYMDKFTISYANAIQIVIAKQITKIEKDLIQHMKKHLYKHITIWIMKYIYSIIYMDVVNEIKLVKEDLENVEKKCEKFQKKWTV